MTQVKEQPDLGAINLFNIRERFFMLKGKLTELQTFMSDIADKKHPGVLDLATQYSILLSVCSATSRQFETIKPKEVSTKQIRMLSNLEGLVLEFEDVLLEAHTELTNVE
ncbi:hypothetical protein [Marinobacter sp. ELB17]|uniref:hypothetical protein n=1 Tax=Marinobacter sp. ELB17 TaxID=270374 RepID=UPI0000F3B353|nr:hypothetical protein [Marinobacter sp. ELB17]EAZ98371.1 hypothetical protein MELB17_09098 [Marinobacter sp. ELB17]